MSNSFSGRFVLRIPKGLHAELALQAKRQGVSLNQYAGILLATASSWPAYWREASERRIVEAAQLSETLTTIASAR